MLFSRKTVNCFFRHLCHIYHGYFSVLLWRERNFYDLLHGGFEKVVFLMLKMGHLRESVQKTTFCFTSKSVLYFCLQPIRDIFAVYRSDNHFQLTRNRLSLGEFSELSKNTRPFFCSLQSSPLWLDFLCPAFTQ